jgi:hypothetical protein
MYKGVSVVISGSSGAATSTPDDPLLRTGQIASMLAPWGFSRGMVSQLINDGEFGDPARYRRAGNKWARVPTSVVQAYIRDKLPALASGEQAGEQPA